MLIVNLLLYESFLNFLRLWELNLSFHITIATHQVATALTITAKYGLDCNVTNLQFLSFFPSFHCNSYFRSEQIYHSNITILLDSLYLYTHRDARLLCVFVRDLRDLVAPLLVQLRDRQAKQLSFDHRVQPEIGFADGALHSADL